MDELTYIIYEADFEDDINKIAIISNENINIIKQKIGNKLYIYVSSYEKIDYKITIKSINKVFPKLEYPIYKKEVATRFCFSDREYSKNAALEKYIHAGTDIDAATYVIASCDAEIIDIWNSNVEMKCQNEQHTIIYKKNQPNEEPGVNYGATVILKCTEYPIYLLYMHLNPENLYIRNPDDPNDFRYYCLGNYVKKGEILGIASDSGDANGIHLHFEVRSGKTEDYGVPPRKNAFNTALLDIFNGLEEKYKTKLQKTFFNQNCFNTFAMTRGATEKELFPEFYS
ncbi:MAG: M23 family metallopeptidase [Candidatus Woesearchaeota archaeon]